MKQAKENPEVLILYPVLGPKLLIFKFNKYKFSFLK